ncbi:MAG: hypothetical protein JXA22_02755 [Candidatus Thermoplasmatota archaeon]|nr:hypothetical protein [Candidatus Thermoplasmatota archaeon]
MKFDLRDLDGENYVSEVKSQSGGTCWAHGTMAAIESDLMMTGLWERVEGNASEPDLAEYHLDWWNGFNDHNNDDRTPPKDSGLFVHNGGDYLVAAAYLARGEGSVRDKDGQFYDDPPERSLPSYHRYYPMDIEWYTIDDELNGIEDIKRAVMEYGAVATCMLADASLRDPTNAHYQPPTDNREPNHAVAIVGWDDAKTTPAPLDGAWLVKNSWGSAWADQGYFWISYYDRWSCRHPEMGAVSFRNVSYLVFDRTYSYDYHGWRDTWYNSTEAFNSYTAERNEQLSGVNFYTTEDSTTVKVTIWDDFEDGVLSNSLRSETRYFERKGLHTVLFEEPLELVGDDDFHIMLNVSRGGIAYDRTSLVPTLLGPPTKEPGFDSWITSRSAPNQSFYRSGSEWKDLFFVNDSANFCIKGLVSHVSIASPMTHDRVSSYYQAYGPVSKEIDQVTARIDGGAPMITIIRDRNWQLELKDVHLTAGPHTLTVTGTQDGCNEVVSSASVVFIFDDIDPITLVDLSGLAGENGWYRSSVDVTLTGTDATSDISLTEYQLDGGYWTEYSGTFSIEKDGIHMLTFRSADIAENVEIPRTIEVRIDTGPPETECILLGDIGGGSWYISPVELRFISSDDISDVKQVELELDGVFLVYDENDPPRVSTSGSHEVSFKAVDIAGNVQSEIRKGFDIDLETPLTDIIINGEKGNNGWYISPIEVELRCREGFSGLEGTFYRIVGGKWEEQTSPISISVDGTYELEYYSEDIAGHREAPERGPIKIDTTPPTTEVVMTSDGLQNGIHLSGVSFNLKAMDATSGISSTYWRIDMGDPHRFSGPFVLEKAGTHTIHYWSRDMAGNIEMFNSVTCSIDLYEPRVGLLEDLDGRTLNKTELYLHPVGIDPEGGELLLNYSLDEGEWVSVARISPGSGFETVQLSALSEGVHVLALKGTDPAGRETIQTYLFAINLTWKPNAGLDDDENDGWKEDRWSGKLILVLVALSIVAILIVLALSYLLGRRKGRGRE